MSKRRVHRSATEWQSIVDKQASSRLSAPAFCKAKNINYQSFSNWRRKLPVSPSEDASLIDVSTLFSPPSSTDSWQIELDLGNGIKLNLSQR